MVKLLNKSEFKLIKGGLCAVPDDNDKSFISAYVTDTRLMGVICVYIHWIAGDEDLHQFFYFDAEEHGFERYKSVAGNDMAQLVIVEQSLAGGLGGRQIDISEKEAVALVREYAEFNISHNLKLPQGYDEYGFLLNREITLTSKEKQQLMNKECTEITSAYQCINYFLMRCFGQDYEAARFLAANDVDITLYNEYKNATFYRNVIDKTPDGSYMCESLIEFNNNYYVQISEICVSDCTVVYFEKCSGFRISSAEAAMMLAKPEFVTVYDILTSPEVFDMGMMELSMNSMVTSHENGRFYMIFNKNNDHVNKRVFKMSEDVYGIYYITAFGQLIAAAYSIENIHSLERDLRRSDLSRYLALVSKYEFKEPILYDFVQSDFEDFEDFLDYIQDFFDEDDD